MSFVKFYRQKLFEAIESLDLLLVKDILSRPDDFGLDWDYRDREGRSVYAHAINIGVTQMVATFIEHCIPLGDALLRASDFCMVDIVRCILTHAATLTENERRAIVECRCENDDYHKITTPLMAAAHKNNFTVVKLLLDAGAVLKEPKITHDQADLTSKAILIMTYTALASEAYIVHAFNDPLDAAFGLSGRLRALAARWEDMSEEVFRIVDRVERFAADFVGQAINSSEVRSILKFTSSESKHPVAKIRAAMKANQRPFVIHPFTQNVLSDSYYEEMKGKSAILSLILTLLAVVCYPVLSICYLIYPAKMLHKLLKIPNIKLYMNMGSDLTLMSCVIALVLYDYTTHPIITLILEIIIFVFCIGISGKHVKFIYNQGPEKFCAYPLSILDSFMVKICYTTFYLVWIGRLIDTYDQRIMQRHVNPLQEAQPDMAPSIANTTNTSTDANSDIASACVTPTWIIMAVWNEPRVISRTLYSIVVLVCVVRTFYVLSVNQVSFFVIAKSVIGMGSDVARMGVLFLCIVIACAVGITHASNYRLLTARAVCAAEERLPNECPDPPFHDIPTSLFNLYFALFGITKKPVAGLQLRVDDSYILYLPAFIFMFYSVIAIIVLLHLLIAVMSSRYSSVERNADREWKFSRTQVWMSFISDEITLPPPFNILPSVDKLRTILQACCHSSQYKERTNTQKKVASKSAWREFKQSQNVSKTMKERFVKSRESSLQQNSEVGSKRAVVICGRTDLLTFRNEWVDLRQQVSVAERDLETMLRKLTELVESLKMKIDIMDHVEEKRVSSSFDIDDVYESVAVIVRSLEHVEVLMETLRTLPPEVLPKPVREKPIFEEKEEKEEEKTEEEIKIEIKKEIVKAMAKFYEQGRRPQEDEEFMKKLNEYRQRFEDSALALS